MHSKFFFSCFWIICLQARQLESVQSLLNRMVLNDQASAASNTNRSAPKSTEEAASRQEWRFWQTQPVPTLGVKINSENNGPVEGDKPIEELRQEPYKLPDGFTWDEIDVLDNGQVIESTRKKASYFVCCCAI